MRLRAVWTCAGVVGLGSLIGCGTTRVTDSARSATEQMLISNSIDQTVSELDFTPLTGKTVFFDPQYLDGCVDKGYLVASVRQQLLAAGCLLQEERPKATYVVEVRAGAVGTDRSDLMFGVPQMNVPSVLPGQPGGMVPEIPLAKRTDKRGVAKIAVVAYNRTTGQAVWQSGVNQAMSSAKETWVFGAGPFQHGTIKDGTQVAGQPVQLAIRETGTELKMMPVTHAAAFQESPILQPVPTTQVTSGPKTEGSGAVPAK